MGMRVFWGGRNRKWNRYRRQQEKGSVIITRTKPNSTNTVRHPPHIRPYRMMLRVYHILFVELIVSPVVLFARQTHITHILCQAGISTIITEHNKT